MKVIYFGYPYSDYPATRTEELKQLIIDLIKVRHDIVPLIPHLMFDSLWNCPDGYDADHLFVLEWEYEVISRADGVCFPTPVTPAHKMCGVYWETAFAKWLTANGVNLPIYKYEDLMEKLDLV